MWIIEGEEGKDAEDDGAGRLVFDETEEDNAPSPVGAFARLHTAGLI